jgi:hypothetical protein
VGGQTGAVTFAQRFGGPMNLNPHLHTLVPDGLTDRLAAGAEVHGDYLDPALAARVVAPTSTGV